MNLLQDAQLLPNSLKEVIKPAPRSRGGVVVVDERWDVEEVAGVAATFGACTLQYGTMQHPCGVSRRDAEAQ